jgi:hypothetical protein
MIIVTGTKRSGTSMWMQILTAAGFPAFGEAFPRNWGATLKDANPDGFYESILRRGIYWRTNPHPVSGAYFFPEQVEKHVVKVFIPGLARTDRAYIGSVIATVRHWREYERSLQRLYAIEDAGRKEGKPPLRMSPVLEWWTENFTLVRDIVTRRYRVHVQSYDGLLRDPPRVIEDTLTWLGSGDVAAAVAAVKPSNRTQARDEQEAAGEEFPPEIREAFELLYTAVDERRPLTAELITALNRTQVALAPRIKEAQQAITRDAQRRRAKQKRSGPEDGGDSEVPSW